MIEEEGGRVVARDLVPESLGRVDALLCKTSTTLIAQVA